MLPIILLLFVTGNCNRLSKDENSHLQKTCGVARLESSSKFKIFGGSLVRPGEYPWMVKLDVHRDFGEDSYREPCSGFLISSRHILTAAHCATNFDHDLAELECLGGISDYEPSTSVPKDFIVYVGTRCNPPEKCKTTYPVAKVILDSKWKRCVKGKDDEFMVNKNDFAILELKNDVSTKDAIPICLPNSQTALAKHLQVTGSGWEKGRFGKRCEKRLKSSLVRVMYR
ncbi:trypsin [Cooperia oncophora]